MITSPESPGPEDRSVASALSVLRALEPTQRDAALDASVVVRFAPGARVVELGAIGDAFFVVLEGEVEVLGGAGEPVVLARLDRGAGFGEQALLPESGGRRNATVVAGAAGARLLKVGRDAFLTAVGTNPDALAVLRRAGAAQLRQRLDAAVSALGFGALPTAGMGERSHAAGEVVFRQGDEGDAVYFVLSGSAVASVDGVRVARLTSGQCFGETAVLRGTGRGATVTADNELRLVRVERAQFLAWYAQTPELRDLVTTLSHVSVDAELGLLTVHHGRWEGQPAVTAVRHTPDGRHVLSTKVAGAAVFSMTVGGVDRANAAPARFHDPTTGARRELQVAGGRIVGVVSEGDWPRLRHVCDRLIRGGQVGARELALFRQLGDLEVEAPDDGADRHLCACLRIDRSVALAAIGAGHDTVEAVCAATGAGSVCGTCTAAVHELVGSTDLVALRVDEVAASTPDIWRLLLRSAGRPLPAVRPGQHVLLRGLLAEGWVQRAYSLSDAKDDEWEILVKRETGGLMSTWLCDAARRGEVLRASPPIGRFVLPRDPEADVVFLAGGVGVTPALAMARVQARDRHVRHLHVVYSATDRADFAEPVALDALAASAPWLTIDLHPTRERGRLTLEHVLALTARYPTARFLLCGSDAFRLGLTEHLATAGVSSARVAFEAFTPVGRTAATSNAAPARSPASSDVLAAARASWASARERSGAQADVRDATACAHADAVVDRIIGHICAVAHGGERPVVTVFGPQVRLWNSTVVAWATDSASAPTVDVLARLGWAGGGELLPLAIQVGDDPPSVRPLPPTLTLPPPGCDAGRFVELRVEGVRVGLALWFDPAAAPVVRRMDPPIARPGAQALPLVGPVLAGIATAQGPLEQALVCRAVAGEVFGARLPGQPPMTWLLGAKGHSFMNSLPVEAAGVGQVLQLVPVFGTFIARSDPSTEYLELLAIGGRAYLQAHLVRPDQVAAMREPVDADAARQLATWNGEVDLARVAIDLLQRVSLRCIAGSETAQTVGPVIQPLLRTIAAGVDVPRLAAAGSPARWLLAEYWAARKLSAFLSTWTANGGGGAFVDGLRERMRVDGAPLREADVPWAIAYVLFNACAYSGSYGFWTLVDLLSGDPEATARIRAAAPDDARAEVERGLLETLRRHPVTVLARNLKTDVEYDHGGVRYTIPAGHFLHAAPGSFTRDPEVYADPDAYCPARFTRGEPEPEAFGGGVFGCIAQGYVRMLIPTVLTRLLRTVDVALLGSIPHRKARPALHYPRSALPARVTPLP